MDCGNLISIVLTVLLCIGIIIGLVQFFIFEFHWFYHNLLKLKNKIDNEKNKK